ncbi:hypothetical protein [Bacillus benzoevorans]|uniref:Tfp pilus assembly protein PilO n=1 Tax=Bacillus benzoevorans TaxID=1456 RepID=A0A7X0LWA8_9BACI|nr:hypothetical protein [Bacillus benzoevorans]MBB6446440.1 Tfp pilus assembly protein PilO [Bacillus benzoevorans]
MTIELGVLLSVMAVVIAYQGYQLNKQKSLTDKEKDVKNDTKEDAKESAELKAQLSYISKGVDDIRIDIKTNERQMVLFGERLARNEESTKSAHKRIDTLEKEAN